MATAIYLSDELVSIATSHAAAAHRTVPDQLEYWARLGRAADENPELPIEFIKATLLGIAEASEGKVQQYELGK